MVSLHHRGVTRQLFGRKGMEQFLPTILGCIKSRTQIQLRQTPALRSEDKPDINWDGRFW